MEIISSHGSKLSPKQKEAKTNNGRKLLRRVADISLNFFLLPLAFEIHEQNATQYDMANLENNCCHA